MMLLTNRASSSIDAIRCPRKIIGRETAVLVCECVEHIRTVSSLRPEKTPMPTAKPATLPSADVTLPATRFRLSNWLFRSLTTIVPSTIFSSRRLDPMLVA